MTVRERLTWPLVHATDRIRYRRLARAYSRGLDVAARTRGGLYVMADVPQAYFADAVRYVAAAGHDVSGLHTDAERAARLRRGRECDNLDHAHYTQRFGQVLQQRDDLRDQVFRLQAALQHVAAERDDLAKRLASTQDHVTYLERAQYRDIA